MTDNFPTTPTRRPGRFTGIGTGPGDPDLLTVASVNALRATDVIAFHAKKSGSSHALHTVAAYLPDDVITEELVYPVTTGTTDHPGGYAGAMGEFYDRAVDRLGGHLRAGRNVTVVSVGDPMLHSSQQHLLRRLRPLASSARIIPGISSVGAAAAVTGLPLAENNEVLSIIPATATEEEIVAAVRACDSAVIMKLGRTFGKVRRALVTAGVADRAVVAIRVGMEGETTIPLLQATADQVPYFAVVQIPSADCRNATASRQQDHGGPGKVTVVGLGPGPGRWTTPEATEALASATDIVGYDTYVKRVALADWQTARPSDNMVEHERAVMALDLAARGRNVAVVSSGDPGVFAMATAVFEAADTDGYRDIDIAVIPGMTAAQAVASRVGAPLGHDFGMISLSTRLKPWAIIETRIRALAAADMAFAVYNPASKTRRESLVSMLRIVAEYRTGDTPVVVARAVGTAGEEVTVTTLDSVDPARVDMRTMVIVGASTTRISRGPDGPRVYTPRTYQLHQPDTDPLQSGQ
ncbi:precorrin-3B C(17)-methyltransferase [Corynebacterium mendelii]|uniref:precorrin-3B C(17)-methyltransferase n=1 Tax=Corynebacterium mendelii TaxID=2765362 RepID=UPI002ED14B58